MGSLPLTPLLFGRTPVEWALESPTPDALPILVCPSHTLPLLHEVVHLDIVAGRRRANACQREHEARADNHAHLRGTNLRVRAD